METDCVLVQLISTDYFSTFALPDVVLRGRTIAHGEHESFAGSLGMERAVDSLFRDEFPSCSQS